MGKVTPIFWVGFTWGWPNYVSSEVRLNGWKSRGQSALVATTTHHKTDSENTVERHERELLRRLTSEVLAELKDGDKAKEELQRWSRVATKDEPKLEGLSAYHQATAVDARLATLRALEQKATDLGYTSLGKLVEGVGKTKQARLPELYNTVPPKWVQDARLERVRNGLKERTYKVPAVTPRQAQANLKSLRPVLEELYEVWEWEKNPTDDAFKAVEDAFVNKPYLTFYKLVQESLFEAKTGLLVEDEVEEVFEEQTAEPAEDLAALLNYRTPEWAVGSLD